jgi:hypothetical protein
VIHQVIARTGAFERGDAGLSEKYVLGPVPEVDVMAKRPQGLLNVGDSFRADGGAAVLRSCALDI